MNNLQDWYIEAKILFAFLHKQGITYRNYSIASEEDIETLLGEADITWINQLLSAFRAGMECKTWQESQAEAGDPIELFPQELDWNGKIIPEIKH